MSDILYAFFLFIGMSRLQIERFKWEFAKIDVLGERNAMYCISILVALGYPKEKLPYLIAKNPYFMFSDPDELRLKLYMIDGDLGEVLDENPFII